MIQTIVLVIVVFMLVGLLVWLAERMVPIPIEFQRVLRVIVLILLVIWALYVSGVWAMLARL